MTGEKCGKGDARHACDPGSSSKPESLTVGFRKETALQGCKAVADIISGMLAGVDAPLMFEVALEMPDGTEHNLGAVKAQKHTGMDSSIYSCFGIVTPDLVQHGNHHLKVTARDNRGIVLAEGSGRVEVMRCGG